MTCHRITSHVLPLTSESPRGSRVSRGSARAATPDSFRRGTPATRLASTLCPEAPEAGRDLSPTMIPGSLRQADRLARTALERSEVGESRVELNRAVDAYNAAVRTWRAYEAGRPAGSPRSEIIRVLPWGETRERLLAAASSRGFRLTGLEESPTEQYVFRLAETESPRMGSVEVSRSVLRLTRIRNRIRQLDEIEDDSSRPMRERLRAAAAALSLVREASRLVAQIRSRSDAGNDPRVLRLSREIIHAACDEPADIRVAGSDSPEWIARIARLYSGSAETSISYAFDRRGGMGSENRILMARLLMTRSRRAAAALPLSSDPAQAGTLGHELSRERVAVHGRMRREQSRIVRAEVREARRLMLRAHAVLSRPSRRVGAERREAAVADYRRAQDIMAYLSELGTGDRRVTRLRDDRRWARLETTVGRAAV